MIRRPTRTTRTVTNFPDTTLFRSRRDLPAEAARLGRRLGAREADLGAEEAAGIGGNPQWVARGEEPPSVGLADIGSKVAMTREVVGEAVGNDFRLVEQQHRCRQRRPEKMCHQRIRSEEHTSELQSLMRNSN